MKTTVSEYDFHNAFEEYGRGDNFSSHGLEMLYEYLTNYEEEVGEEIEFDVIAFCCEFTVLLLFIECRCQHNMPVSCAS